MSRVVSRAVHPSRIQRGEIVAAVGGILLGIALFLIAYEPSSNPNAVIAGAREAVTAWDIHNILRWVLLATAIAPIVLLYIVMRDHQLSWPRGELTAVLGIFAIGLIFYNGVLDRPGEPSGQISLGIGWYAMLVGALLIIVGGTMRAGESERRRKPPGVL